MLERGGGTGKAGVRKERGRKRVGYKGKGTGSDRDKIEWTLGIKGLW